ncbi:MAG: acyl-CoA dehydrogenase family protein, partial [Deltaproteobacteria bacterium]|nr:acyl-CoA dehydrogenase family protein [Deltaproteobacteria bacterium]
MDFELSEKAQAVEEQLCRFMDEYVYPAEREYLEQSEAKPKEEPGIMLDLRAKAKEIGLWNLFLPDEEWGAGLTNLEYTPLCEIMGRSGLAARVFNCQAPDTGNAEILAEFGSEEQK